MHIPTNRFQNEFAHRLHDREHNAEAAFADLEWVCLWRVSGIITAGLLAMESRAFGVLDRDGYVDS